MVAICVALKHMEASMSQDSRSPEQAKDSQQTEPQAKDIDNVRQSRRRLLTMIGAGLAGAYVAPTLFSIGQAQAGDWRNSYSYPSYSRPSYSRPSYSRPSYSRPSGYDYRRRDRLREYSDDPIRILEDVIFGTTKR